MWGKGANLEQAGLYFLACFGVFFFPLLHPHCPMNLRMETMVRLDVPVKIMCVKDGRRLVHPHGATGLVLARPWDSPGQLCCVLGQLTAWPIHCCFSSPLFPESWLLAGAYHIPCQRCPRALSVSPQPWGMDRAASGSLASFAHPERDLHSAPCFPGTTRAGSVC